jgi:exodeoxyribonuclease VII large subunit
VRRAAQRLDDLIFRQESALTAQLRQRRMRVDSLTAAQLHHDPRQSMARARAHLTDLGTRLQRTLDHTVSGARIRLGAHDARLRALSPLAVLDRGYALVLTADGGLIRSSSQLNTGDLLTTRLADGQFTSRVESAGPSPQPLRRPNPKEG